MELVYKESCPYCRAIARGVDVADIPDRIRLTAIESERGRSLIEDHHGEYVEAPHLFTSDLVYYGVAPTAKGLAKEYPKALFGGQSSSSTGA
jgi:predicted DCC family thiol-disulfide oxidoreductase YuxK